ncbi:MAG: Flp pilus assembly protein CpaB [Anaerolineae bacterium]|nr:Flp pilus assembly protein CpaB [Anaerolineae bacterium]MDW8172428.1 Flp pilus assembly protein CpaB [Anaerolineae bacterium]
MKGPTLVIILLLIVILVAGGALLLLGGQQPAPAQETSAGAASESASNANNEPFFQPRETPLPTITPIPLIEVVIAVQDIPRGVPIAANAIELVRVPEETAPFAAFSNIEDVIGKIARTDIYREQVILSNLLVEDLQRLGNVGSDAAAVLPPNRVMIAVPIDRLTSVAYAIQPGDRVDVIASMLFVDVDTNFQSIEPNQFSLISVLPVTLEDGSRAVRIEPSTQVQGAFDSRLIPNAGTFPVIVSPSEPPRPRLATQNIIQDALVVWLGDFPEDGRIFAPAPTPTPNVTPTPVVEGEAGADTPPPPPTIPPRPDIISLGVTPQDAVVLTYLIESGIPLTFALRSAATTSLPQTNVVTLNYIMEQYRISVPEKFNYALQPAIRNIRSIQLSRTISLAGTNNQNQPGQ